MFQTTNQTSLKPSKHLAFGLLELRHCQPPNLCIRLGCGSKLELHPVFSSLQSTNRARENVWKCLRGKSTNSMSISIFSMAMLAYQIVNTQTCWQLVSWLHFFPALKGSWFNGMQKLSDIRKKLIMREFVQTQEFNLLIVWATSPKIGYLLWVCHQRYDHMAAIIWPFGDSSVKFTRLPSGNLT